MKAAITGGAWFVGSHLAEELLHTGDVCVIDDLLTDSIESIQHLKRWTGFKYVIDTVLNGGLMVELADEADVVLHLAAVVGDAHVGMACLAPVREWTPGDRGPGAVMATAESGGNEDGGMPRASWFPVGMGWPRWEARLLRAGWC